MFENCIQMATEEDYTLPLGFPGIKQSKARRLLATVPNLLQQCSHSKRNQDYKVPLCTGNQGLLNNLLN